MTTDEIIRVINNSDICSLDYFLKKYQQMFPEIYNVCVIDKKDMGVSGILAAARYNVEKDEVIIKGFLYTPKNWSPCTHGYVIAKKI